MLFGVHACARVFDEHKGKTEPSTLARGGLDAVIRGDTVRTLDFRRASIQSDDRSIHGT